MSNPDPAPVDDTLGQALAHIDGFLEAVRRMRSRPSPQARYREHVQLEPGARVGWVDVNGVLHVDTVREHEPVARGGHCRGHTARRLESFLVAA
ncbi:hypothetical protein [Nocardia wallacei]|uniref:hypothetical protein n=1 Tax=Nocardia wallacei TaxID=480035 RepID=UPI002458CD59|nr:hypothetical protein [Nocardia wallacei]